MENAPTGSGLLITEKNVVPIYNQLIPARTRDIGFRGVENAKENTYCNPVFDCIFSDTVTSTRTYVQYRVPT